MKQGQALEYLKSRIDGYIRPRIESFRSQEMVESLGSAEGGPVVSGAVEDDNCPPDDLP